MGLTMRGRFIMEGLGLGLWRGGGLFKSKLLPSIDMEEKEGFNIMSTVVLTYFFNEMQEVCIFCMQEE